ncbi:nidogen [Centruroides vittatus]|uniref:nidogen n=1 Tax=Centruroides vittatus TaxID=120091 RepID=UPI00351018CF
MLRKVIIFFLYWICSQNFVNSLSKNDLYPYGLEVDNYLPSEIDDISSLEVQLSVPIVFYDINYKTIFVNDNGLLSFLTEVPAFFNAQFPLTYPIIAPLYSDVDTRGTGRIYYRETRAADLLERASRDIHRHFSQSSNFQPISIFIATWDGVGHYEKGVGLVNTFQVVIVTDGEDSYAYFLYPDGGIQWIQGDGKNANLPDARAQAGFMSGDGRLYTLRGSGTDQARNFDRMSNIRQPGVWLFHIGKTESNGNVLPADLDLDPNIIELSSCANTLLPCPPTSKCVDYEQGFCCKCLNTHFGNGRNCLLKGEPQRLNGKVNGILNDFQLEDVDLHAYVVTADGRTYTAVSRAPPSIGYDMQSLTILGGVIGWLFALPGKDARNGFMTTGGAFNRTAEIKFPQSGHHVTVKEQFLGPDVFNYMKLNIEIRGSLPTIPYGSKIDIDDFEEEYTKVSNGVIRSHSSRSYRLEGNNLEVPFTVDQTISYTICEFEPQDPKLDIMRLKVTRNFIVYDDKEQIVRYAMSNKISPLTSEDPCKEGKYQCGANSKCIVEGDNFRCICDQGYEYLYEDDVNGERATCIDINECTIGKANCHHEADCINLLGSFSCHCKTGYIGNGLDCRRMDTCADIQCDPNASCIQLQNQSAVCICNEGYNGNGYICYQDEENQNTRDCRYNNDCHPFAECILNEATQQYQCQCREGYRGNGIICVDDTQSCNFAHNCHSDADCTYDSFSGNYACSCKQGFTGNGYYCVAKDCNTLNTCHPHAQCIYDHSTGEYQCQCNAGYIGDGYQCTQSDEVSCDVVNVCSVHAVCVYDSYLQKYVCQCKNGYDGDGLTCRAIDECNTVENCDKNAQCIYDTQSEHYRCVCNSGYVGNGKTCSPATDATCNIVNNCDINARCIYDHVDLKYRCHCNSGYQGDGLTCQPAVVSCNIVYTCSVYAECVYDPNVQSYRCQCLQGYEGDGVTCTPIATCHENPYLCDYNAECIYTTSGYVCQCKSGYTGDGTTCNVAPRHEGNFLVFAQGMSLLQMPYNPTKQDQGKLLLMEAYQTAVGMDVDCQEGYIYWTDISHKAIRRVKYDGSESEIIFTREVKSPEGIAVDWISRNAYWTDSVKDTIEVMKLDGMEHKILIRENLVNPRGITLHPGRGKLFWTDWNRNEPKIETSNMDGSERKVFISEDLGLPNMLTIDLERDDLCWTDAGLRRIECINVDGYRRRIIYTPAAYPFDLTIANNNIYWTDWEINFIQKVDKNGGTAEPLEIPLGGNGKLYGIVSVPYQCPQINNVCGSFNGGCNHLCLPDGKGGRTCVCPDYQEGSEIDEACNDV